MYMFPEASSVTSLVPQKAASVAGPPSPSCEPPSPATVFMVAAFSDPSLALLPPPQALAAKTTSVTTSPSLRICLTILLRWGYICSSTSATFPTTSCYGEAHTQNSFSKAPGLLPARTPGDKECSSHWEGYLTLQPFGFGSKITSPSAGVFVGAMNVTYRTALALPRLRTTCTSPLVSKKPSPALTTLL